MEEKKAFEDPEVISYDKEEFEVDVAFTGNGTDIKGDG